VGLVLVRCSRWVGLAIWWSVIACSESETDAGTDVPSGTTGDAHGTTTDDEPLDHSPADQCAAAPRVGAGRYLGSLRDKSSDRGGACGLGGPDAFVTLEVPRRVDVRVRARGVDFDPVVGVRSPRCAHDWSTQLLCTHGFEGWVLDVPAGGALLVSVGIAPDDPALASSAIAGVADPLDFRLDLELRNVLLEGERCTPASRGRCVSGTACVSEDPSASSDGTAESPRCLAIEGDTCASAIPLALELGTTVVTIDRNAVQTDAHAHSCGGARRPERVLHLGLPGDLEAGARLRARTLAPDVLLALRGPGCIIEEEIACSPGGEDGSVVVVEDLFAVRTSGPYLFVELPRVAPEETGTGDNPESEPGELAPLYVELELSGG
jgi:hypothetical protein